MSRETRKRLIPDQPISYEILVQGYLSPTSADYLGGVAVSTSGGRDSTVTTLSGQAADRAALMGLLNSLYDLGLTLLSVECQPEVREEDAQDQKV